MHACSPRVSDTPAHFRACLVRHLLYILTMCLIPIDSAPEAVMARWMPTPAMAMMLHVLCLYIKPRLPGDAVHDGHGCGLGHGVSRCRRQLAKLVMPI